MQLAVDATLVEMGDLPEARVVRVGEPRAATSTAPTVPALRLAPRRLPRALVWRLWFHLDKGRFGWWFAAFGMGFACVFIPQVQLAPQLFDRTTRGTIQSVEQTTMSENEREIYRVTYTFDDDRGIARTGTSYTKDAAVSGAQEIEYDEDDPTHSRLVGARTKPFGLWVALVTLVFPALGLWFALSGFLAGRKAVRLLRFGVETTGKLIDKTRSKVELDEQPLYRLTFEYVVDGQRFTTTVETMRPEVLEDDAHERLVFDPWDRTIATTLDHLPGQPRISPDGELASDGGVGVHLLILPIATLGLFITMVALSV